MEKLANIALFGLLSVILSFLVFNFIDNFDTDVAVQDFIHNGIDFEMFLKQGTKY